VLCYGSIRHLGLLQRKKVGDNLGTNIDQYREKPIWMT
jgi:hypothetical protein